MVETLRGLQSLVRGTPIRVSMANSYTDNVKIVNADGDVIFKQLNNNVGLTATAVVKASVAVWRKREAGRVHAQKFVKFMNKKDFGDD